MKRLEAKQSTVLDNWIDTKVKPKSKPRSKHSRTKEISLLYQEYAYDLWCHVYKVIGCDIIRLCKYCTGRSKCPYIEDGYINIGHQLERENCCKQRLRLYFMNYRTFIFPSDLHILNLEMLMKHKPKSYQSKLHFIVSNSLALTCTVGSDQR